MHSSVLAIDTEFLREKTYYAKLCLIQLATDDETAIVDPFAVDDLKVLAPVLRNENVMKLFHAGNQDLEILLREVGVLPHPLFDTQVAAALLGHTQQIGYAALVHAECGVTLKKIDSFTDWSRRPLSDSQLEYAADDVVYLPRMYERLQARAPFHRRPVHGARAVRPPLHEGRAHRGVADRVRVGRVSRHLARA